MDLTTICIAAASMLLIVKVRRVPEPVVIVFAAVVGVLFVQDV